MSQDRKILYSQYNHRYKLFCPDKRKRYICFYCGLPAPTLDHVPPLNKVADLLMEYESLDYKKVPSCQECNGIASDFPHINIYERQKYIKSKLKKKYLKYIQSIDWEEDEIESLGYRLKQQIVASMSIKYLVAYRLTYGEDANFRMKDLGYMQFDPRKILKYAQVNKWDDSFESINNEQTLEEVNAFFNKTAKNRNESFEYKKIKLKKNHEYLCYEDFKKYLCDEESIFNSSSYIEHRKSKKIIRKKLPPNPSSFYGDSWEGWKSILGNQYKTSQFRVNESKLLTFESFKKKLINSGVRNSVEFGDWRRSLSNEEKSLITSSPQNYYLNEWKGWKDLLGEKYNHGYSKRLVDKSKLLSYKKFKNALQKSGIKNSTEFSKWRQSLSEKEKIRIPSQPSSYFKMQWEGWEKLLGGNYINSSSNSKASSHELLDYFKYPKFIIIIKQYKLMQSKDYQGWLFNLPIEIKNKMPRNPVVYYRSKWEGWDRILNS